MHRRIVFALFTLLLVPLAAHALSAETQAQLDMLNQIAAKIQAQLGVSPTTGTPAPTSCTVLTSKLEQGSRDAATGGQVSALQRFLISTGDYTYSGVTGYFGLQTQLALQKWQARMGLMTGGSPTTNGFGTVGPRTRALMFSQSCGTSQVGTGTGISGNTSLCSLDGQSVATGGTMQLYDTQSVSGGDSCESHRATRQCVGGALGGDSSYRYASCSSAAVCVVGGLTMKTGESRTFYNVPSVTPDAKCADHSQVRTCSGGTLSGDGSYPFAGCASKAALPCTLNGKTITSGSSAIFYSTSTPSYTSSCSSYAQTRACNNGTFSGDAAFNNPSCSASGGAACTMDGVTVANLGTTTLYLAHNIPASEKCTSYSQTATCYNGTFSSNASYKYSSCAPVASGSCTVDNLVLANGASGTFYSAGSAPSGTKCSTIAQGRTCTSGTLSGSATYSRASCTDTASCTLAGTTTSNGASAVFYSASSVAYGTTCSSIAKTRVCNNGLFSEDASFQYASCTVNPPVAFNSIASQLADAVTAFEVFIYNFVAQMSR